MPEVRYKLTYDDKGNLIETTPYEVSDEELHQEALDAEFNDKVHQGLIAYNSWDSLTKAQRDVALKNMLGFLLYKEGLL